MSKYKVTISIALIDVGPNQENEIIEDHEYNFPLDNIEDYNAFMVDLNLIKKEED